ncbi:MULTISPECIES: MmgE/PrpD family protein [Sphingomonadales]|uniref:MmgE/PrpD family protein n=1 Tax=Sphingomonadales TaxID=204457 RepID=UPI0032674285
MTQESLTEKLAHHLTRPVDEATRQRARLHLLDWLGCVAGARKSDIAQRLRGTGWSRPDDLIRFLGNQLEMDDVHRTAILHPGPVIWPSVLTDSDGMNAILNRAVRGYEAMIGVGATLDAYHYAYYHPTATAGAFGSVAANIVGGDAETGIIEIDKTFEELVNGLGLAGSLAGGLWQMRNEDCDAKQWHVNWVVFNAFNTALAAVDGIKGPRFILEGPQGLYAATCKNPKPMTFPDEWRIHQVSFKPWGACRHAHPAIDAALELKSRLGSLDGDIQVETYADAVTFCDRANPETVIDAKFSIQHAVAVIAERGVPQLADFELDAIPPLAGGRGRVSVAANADIAARYPEHYGARVTCNGETAELIDTLGDPERPLSKEGVIDKTRALIAWGGLPDEEADRAIDLALHGDDAGAVSKLLEDWLS